MPPTPQYQTFTIADALAPKQTAPMLVEKVLPQGSISIWYGYPGSLKSAIVLDLCMSVVSGTPWLPSMPNGGGTFPGFKTTQAPVLWIDLDNGYEITSERIAAMTRARKIDPAAPFFYMSYPTPAIQASRAASIAALTSHIMNDLPLRPGLIVLDTLLRAAHVKDENASEMDTVLNNLHKMAEDLKAALAMISHSKKENYGRAGNGLRGHSSIEGGVDYVFYVKRENHSDVIEVENQKARRKPVDTFGARWTYLQDIDGESLREARFYYETGTPMNKQQQTIANIQQKIVDTLTSKGRLKTADLYDEIGGYRQNFNDALDNLVQTSIVRKIAGQYHSSFYEVI